MKTIEAELEGQMAKIEQQALQKAKQEHDQDKRLLQQKMNSELTELQTQLRLFQKVCIIFFLILVRKKNSYRGAENLDLNLEILT